MAAVHGPLLPAIVTDQNAVQVMRSAIQAVEEIDAALARMASWAASACCTRVISSARSVSSAGADLVVSTAATVKIAPMTSAIRARSQRQRAAGRRSPRAATTA